MSDWHDAERRIEKAQELFAQQRWQEALDELRAAIAINPYNGAWHFNLGLTLDELERFDEAINAYRRSLEIDPDDVEALYRVGMDLLRLSQFESAIASFARIQEVDPTFEPSYCGRIIAYTELGDHDQAEEMFYLARHFKDECPHCYANIARSLFQRHLYDKAIYCWQRTLDLDESHPEVHQCIAQAFRAKGELEKARQHYLQELRINPGDMHTLLDLGDLLLEMGRIDDAGEKLRRAIELAPQHPAAHLHYARWLRSCDRLAAARNALNKALELDPHYPGIHICLAQICIQERDLPHALRHLRAELRLQPEDPDLLMELANLFMDCSQGRPAAACLQRLVAFQPHDLHAWQNLAVAYFMARHYAEGIAACQEALKLDPSQTMTLYNLALAYHHQGDYITALAWLHHATQLDPHDPSLQRLELRIRLLMAWNWLKRFLHPFFFFWHRPPRLPLEPKS
ncbi:MAG TPA: tetratricopeptide repeat protein [Tepidisphaeraceae bacterium]|nr:tetratricopeptide repeat protein [Tepidisphaeraceae bacterium]